MPRAPSGWTRILREASDAARSGDAHGLDLLLGALRWRYDTARNAAVVALASPSPAPPPPPPLQARALAARGADTAVERRAAIDALALIGDRRVLPVIRRG